MRYTTALLAPTVRLTHSRRNRIVLAIVTIGLTLFAIGVALGSRRPELPVQPRLIEPQIIIMVWTPSPAPSATAAPTAEPWPTPEPVVIIQRVEVPVYVEAAPTQPEPVEQAAYPTAAQEAVPAMLPGESLSDFALRQQIEQHTMGGRP